jgi:hypothetical protein
LEEAALKKAVILRDVKMGKYTGFNAPMLEKQINELFQEHSRLGINFTKEFKASCGVLNRVKKFLGFRPSGVGKDGVSVEKHLTEGHITGVDGKDVAVAGGLERTEEGFIARQTEKLRRTFLEGVSAQKEAIQGGQKISRLAKIRTLGGKLFHYAPMIGLGALGTVLSHDSETSWGKAAAQTALDLAPYTGTASDFYSFWQGKEVITGRKLDWTDRGIRLLFGVGGFVSDVANSSVLGAPLGLSIRGIIDGARITKTAVRGEKMIESARAIAAGSKASREIEAGAELLVKEGRALEAGGEAAAKALKAGEKGVEGATRLERTRKILGNVGKYSTRAAIGGIIGSFGYNYFFKPEEAVDIDENMRDVLGSHLTEIDDHEIEDKDSGQTLSSLITQPQ